MSRSQEGATHYQLALQRRLSNKLQLQNINEKYAYYLQGLACLGRWHDPTNSTRCWTNSKVSKCVHG